MHVVRPGRRPSRTGSASRGTRRAVPRRRPARRERRRTGRRTVQAARLPAVIGRTPRCPVRARPSPCRAGPPSEECHRRARPRPPQSILDSSRPETNTGTPSRRAYECRSRNARTRLPGVLDGRELLLLAVEEAVRRARGRRRARARRPRLEGSSNASTSESDTPVVPAHEAQDRGVQSAACCVGLGTIAAPRPGGARRSRRRLRDRARPRWRATNACRRGRT